MLQRQPNAGDYGLLLLLGAIWGSSFAFIKIAVDEVPPITLTAVRLCLASLFLMAIVAFMKGAMPKGKSLWVKILLAAFFGNALPFALIAWGQQSVPSNTAAILMGIMPLTTLVLAHLFTDDDKLNARKTIGMVAGLVGLMVLFGPEALQGLTASTLGMLALLGAAVCYGFNAIVVRRMNAPDRTSAVTIVMMLSALMVVPFAFILEEPLAVGASSTAWGSVVTLGLVHTAIATLIMFAIVARAGASFFGQINLLVPVFGVVWGAILVSETPGVNAIVALGLIVLGILIARGGLALSKQAAGAEKGAIKS